MNEKITPNVVIILAVSASLLVGAGLMFVLMHDDTSDELTLSPNIYGISLSKLWGIVTDEADFDNSTAILSQFRIMTDTDGVLESLILDFHADEGGVHQVYHVEVNPAGTISWYSSTMNNAPPRGTHPLNLLTEIEQIPYRELIRENTGIVMQVDPEWGDLDYDARYVSLFALDNGVLTPLNKVGFHTDEPFYDISICHRMDNEPFTPSGNMSSKDSPCIILFTVSGLEKACVVEYL